jgi:hypothetical protein
MSNIKLGGKPPRRRVNCGWSRISTPFGDCRFCGEPAEPGAKRMCIDCEIEQGSTPVKPSPEKKNKPKK